MLTKIDSALICYFEKVAHGFQRLTGKNNFWLGWAIFWSRILYEIYVTYMESIKDSVLATSGKLALILVIFMALQFATSRLLARWTSGINRGSFRTRNPFENMLIGKIVRLLFWFFLFESIFRAYTGSGKWSGTGSALLRVIMWYFFSCTPLPPGESTLSKFFNYIRAAFMPKATA